MTTNTANIPASSTGPTLEDEAATLEAASSAAEATTPELDGETPEVDPDRPEWLPEKFATTEDLAKAYAELEKNNSTPADPEAAEEAAEGAVDAAGLDMDALRTEYADNGELSAKSIEALGKQGITPEMVNSYVTGQTAEANAVREGLLGPVGGEEAYNDMVAWAADNLEADAIDAFNNVLEGGDTNATKMAVENLNTKYRAANGNEPAVALNGKPTANAASAYASTADLMKDMGNPEYAKNAAFRAKVEAKLGRSSIM